MPAFPIHNYVILDGKGNYLNKKEIWVEFPGFEKCTPIRRTAINAKGVCKSKGGVSVIKVGGGKGKWTPIL